MALSEVQSKNCSLSKALSNFCTPQIPDAEAKPQNTTLQISAVQYKGDCTVHKSQAVLKPASLGARASPGALAQRAEG